MASKVTTWNLHNSCTLRSLLRSPTRTSKLAADSDYVAKRVRNATIGRELVRLSVQAGLRVRSVEPIAVMFRDFETADEILGLRRNADRAVQAGSLADSQVNAWVRRLATGPVVAGFTFYVVVAEA